MNWLFFAMETCSLRPFSAPHWVLTGFYGAQKKNIVLCLWHSIKCNKNVWCGVNLISNRVVGFLFLLVVPSPFPSAGRDITIITKNRHEISIIQMYPCMSLKMLRSGVESGHDSTSAGERALSILTSVYTSGTFSTSSLDSCVKREVIAVED